MCENLAGSSGRRWPRHHHHCRQKKGVPGISLLVGLGVVVRVIVILTGWLALFRGVFLGYFTVPILLVSALAILYSVTDVGLFITVRRRERARKERSAFLRAQRKAHALDMMGRSSDA